MPTHLLFAAAYVLAAGVTVSFVYPGSTVSLVWPSAGIAVWWALICRSARAFTCVCAVVFLVPTLYFHVMQGSPLETVWLVGVAHVLAGPAIRPVMALFERVRARAPSDPGDRGGSPLARIAVPGDVYRLLIASLIAIPVAKCVSITWLAMDGVPISVDIYTNLLLRDLSGVMVVAGPGLAIASSKLRGSTPRRFVNPSS